MNQPTDRLGQPLAVGDWVVADGPKVAPMYNGKRYQFSGLSGRIDGALSFDGTYVVGMPEDVRKINPKPETTRWDDCVWAPEGVKG